MPAPLAARERSIQARMTGDAEEKARADAGRRDDEVCCILVGS